MMRVALPAEHRGPHRSLADAAGARLLMSANRPAAATFLASAKTSAENIVGNICAAEQRFASPRRMGFCGRISRLESPAPRTT
jgi:hypothetical protein